MIDRRITSMTLHVRTAAQRDAARYWSRDSAVYGGTVRLPDYMVYAFGADNNTDIDSISVLTRYPLVHAWDAEIKEHYNKCMSGRRVWPECVVRKPTPLALP